LDAFSQGTVPVLFACPNIGEFFNPAGVLLWQSIAELRDIMDKLSIELYDSMRPAIEDNLSRIGEYSITDDWLYHHIFKEYE
jgi:hypothetical protein